MVRETDRVGEEQAERDQRGHREGGSQQCPASGEGHRFRTLAHQEETVPGERGERRVFRRRAQEDGRNEVEDRVAPGRREEETREQEADRLRLGGDFRDQRGKEPRPRSLGREHEGRHIVHVKSG